MALADDNLYQIPFLQGNDTFYDWVNYHNTLLVGKLNNMRVYDGVSGDGIVFTLGTTASNDPVGGATAGSDLVAGTFRVDIAETIARGVTFQGDVSIDGTLNYDLNRTELASIKSFVHPVGGYTAARDGFTVGQPIRVQDAGDVTGPDIIAGATGSANYYLARADNAPWAEVFGVVSGVTWPTVAGGTLPAGPYTSSNTYVEVTTHGRVKGKFWKALGYERDIQGLSAGCIYFLDPGRSGGLTHIEPTIAGQVNKPVILGITADEGYVLNYRGQLLTGSGTGGTGGIDNNRFVVALDSGHGFKKGHVVGFKKADGTFDNTNGWFIVTSDHDHLSHAVGLCLQSYVLDGQDYIEVLTTGWEGDLCVGENCSKRDTGILYIGLDGYLTNTYQGSLSKPFAMAWDSGGDGTGVVRGSILNQNHLGAGGGEDPLNMAGNRSRSRDEGSNGNWAYTSSSIGGTTFGSAINENIMINGSFDINQRGIGVGPYGATGTLYFADRWVRTDGCSGASNAGLGATTGTFNIERKTFATNQTEVYGLPTYYYRFQNDVHPQGGTGGQFVQIENRIEDCRTLRNENATLSFWAKCGSAGATGNIVVNQYDGNDLYTEVPGMFELGTTWKKYEIAFRIPDITTTPTGKHYLGVGFDTTRLNTTFDLAKVKLEPGIVATKNGKTDVDKEYTSCKRYFQRSYTVDETSFSRTMLSRVIPSISAVNFTMTPSRDYHYQFPVVMRDTPTVTIHSPESGSTGDAYNQSAEADLRHTNGSYGYNNAPRVAPSAAATITAEYVTKDGLYMFIPAGTVLFDEVSFHYIANAELDGNMINT